MLRPKNGLRPETEKSRPMERRKIKPQKRGTCLALFLLIVVLLALGCGKKGDPLPPLAPEVPAARNLEAVVEQGTVSLSWQVDSMDPKALSGFAVLRSRIDPKADDCPTCPIIFRRIAELPAPQVRWDESRARYVDKPESGYQYTYKITPYGPGGTGGSCEARTALLESSK